MSTLEYSYYTHFQQTASTNFILSDVHIQKIHKHPVSKESMTLSSTISQVWRGHDENSDLSDFSDFARSGPMSDFSSFAL